MRGFSNRATRPESDGPILPPRAREDDHALDIAKRFAPARPYAVIVTSNETISGELGLERPIAMSWDLAKRSFAQGFRCLWNIKRVLVERARLRVKTAYHRVMQARVLPWALAGSGWGMSLGLVALVAVAR